MVGPDRQSQLYGGFGRRNNYIRPRRPYERPSSNFYSHIRVAPHATNSDEDSESETTAFVQHKSLQAEIEEKELELSPTHSYTSPFYQPPTSFAEAAAMPRARRDPYARGNGANDGDPVSCGMDSSSMVPLRASKKKAKKWHILDFNSAIESEDAEDTHSAAASQVPESTPPSPAPTVLSASGPANVTLAEAVTSIGSATSTLSVITAQPVSAVVYPQYQRQRDPHSATVVDKGRGRDYQSSSSHLSHSPTLQSYAQLADLARSTVISSVSPSDELEQEEDSESTRDKLEIIMSRIDSAFDVEEWEPDLPPVDENDYPEKLTIKPQPVSYTTVGSLVKSHETPKFNAPVRMQRDSSSRRPLQGNSQPRGIESFFASRTPPHTNIGSQNSLGFGFGAPNATPSAYYDVPSIQGHVMPQLTDVERQILNIHQHENRFISTNTNPQSVEDASKLIGDPFSRTSDSGRNSDLLGILKSEMAPVSVSSQQSNQISYAGFDKMQTIQRLASYPNPMQEPAKERLAGFALGKLQDSDADDAIASSVFESTPSAMGSNQQGKKLIADFQRKEEERRRGFLDYTFRFPAPVASGQSASQPQVVSGYGAIPNNSFSHKESVYQNNQVPPGYPQPLTAGPPGQRPPPIGANKPQMNLPQILSKGPSSHPVMGQSTFDKPADKRPNNYPWPSTGHGASQKSFSNRPDALNQIRNTEPLENIMKYYPHGFPNDMKSEFKYLPQREINRNLTIIPKEDTEEEKQKKQDDWFHSGVRQFRMNAEERFSDMHQKGIERRNGTTIAPPASPPRIDQHDVLSVEQIKNASTAQCAQPLLQSLLGSLALYSNETPDPQKFSSLSKFYPPPPWMVDDSEKGRKSFFGDDVGPIPKRLGRDPRYQALNDSRRGP